MKKKKFYRNFTLLAWCTGLFAISHHFNKFLDRLEDDDKLYNNLDVVVAIGVGFSTLPLFFIFGRRVWITTILLFASSAPPVVIGYRPRINSHYYLADRLHNKFMDTLNGKTETILSREIRQD